MGLPVINPADIMYDEAELRTEFQAFGASAMAFHLDAFEKIFDLSSEPGDIDALMEESDQKASETIPPQLQIRCQLRT